MDTNSDLYRRLFLIRRFEETVLENFPRGVFFGTTHTCLGQEADAVGVLSLIGADDIVFSNHRGHGHFLAYGGGPRALFAELMGRATGVCGGRGGSQHLQWRNFYTNGVQGGTVPVATGMALAEKFKGSGAIAVSFLGDGTLGEGVIYEAFNMASLWKVPILYVLENNRIAQTTPIESAVAGTIATRFEAFDIPARETETSDVLLIRNISSELIQAVREEGSPRALIIHTHRFGPHSKGDDTRNVESVQQMRLVHDPIIIHGRRLPMDERERIKAEVEQEVRTAFETASSDPFPENIS